MSNKPRNYQKELEAILDGIADYIETAPGAHLLEDSRADGEDPSRTAQELRSTLLQSVTDFEQRKLSAARRIYEQRVAAIDKKRHTLPDTAEERRQQLYAVLGRKPEFGVALTAQYRDFVEMTDEDVESALMELAELGVLDDLEQNDA